MYFQKKNQPPQQQQQDGQDAAAADGQQQQQGSTAARQSPSPAAPLPHPKLQPQPQHQLQERGPGRPAGVDKMAVAAGEYRSAAPPARGAGAGRGAGPASGAGAGTMPGGTAGGGAGGSGFVGSGGASAAAGEGEGEGAGKEDPLPAWYTSRHNDWSPVSAWDEQRAAAGLGNGPASRPGGRSEQQAPVGDAGGRPAGLPKGDRRQQQQQQSKARRGLHPMFAALLTGAPQAGVPLHAPAAAPGSAGAQAAPHSKAGSTHAPSAGVGVGGASVVRPRQYAAGAMDGAEGSTTPGSKRNACKAGDTAAGGEQAVREAAGLSGEHQGTGTAAGVPSAAIAAEKRPAQGGIAAVGQGRAKPALSGAGVPGMAAGAGGSEVECVDLASSDQEQEQQGLLLEGGAERGAASELGGGMSSAGMGGQEAEVELDVEGGVGMDGEVEVTGEVSRETRGRARGSDVGAGAALRQAGGRPGRQGGPGARSHSWTGSGASSGGADRGMARPPAGPVAAEEEHPRAQRRPVPANSWQSGGEGMGPGPAAPPRPAHSHSYSNANTAATAGPRNSGSMATAAPGLGALRWPPAGLPATGGGGPRGRGAGKAAARGGRGGGRSFAGRRGQQGTGRALGGPAGRGSAGLRAEQIDLAVLAELPPDVRREVEREFGKCVCGGRTSTRCQLLTCVDNGVRKLPGVVLVATQRLHA